MRQFADGGRLAGAVDADDQNDIGLDLGVDHERAFDGLQDLDHRLAQGFEQCIDVVELLARDPPPQSFENARARLHAHIGADQPGLEVVQNFRIDLAARQQFLDVGGEPRGPHVQLGAQPLEEAADAGFVGFVRHSSKLSRAEPKRVPQAPIPQGMIAR